MDFAGEALLFLQLSRVHEFVLKTLTNSNSAYSATLKSHLEERSKERRNECLVHLLEYLHDPTFLMENKLDTFGEYGNKNKMYALAATLMKTLLVVAGPGSEEESQLVSFASISADLRREKHHVDRSARD